MHSYLATNSAPSQLEHQDNWSITDTKDIKIIAKHMQDLCTVIDNYIETAPARGVFQFAEACDAMFRASMDESFIQI